MCVSEVARHSAAVALLVAGIASAPAAWGQLVPPPGGPIGGPGTPVFDPGIGAGGGTDPEVRALPNVRAQFRALSWRPDALGFHRGASPDATQCKHYQGIWRTRAADGTNWFLVTRSGNRVALGLFPDAGVPDAVACGENPATWTDQPGNLLAVRMGSRERHGERLRSNRLRPGASFADSPPDGRDVVVRTINYDGRTPGFPAYGHPGSMDAIGDVLAVALEYPMAAGVPANAIQFLDVGDPANPVPLSVYALPDGVLAGLVSLAKLRNGRYAMLVTGGRNATLWFFESLPTRADGSTDLRSPQLGWRLLRTWTGAADAGFLGPGVDWPDDTGSAHQTLQFVREGSIRGPLYLMGARGKFATGDDLMDLYLVDFQGSNEDLTHLWLRHVTTVHKDTKPNLDDSRGCLLQDGCANTASFAAGSTFHVTPSGELLFYATSHDNDGPGLAVLTNGQRVRESIKVGEWRHRDVVRPGSPTLNPTLEAPPRYVVREGASTLLRASGGPPLTKAWIQLWADPDYAGRYAVIDWADFAKDDFDDFRDLDGSLLDVTNGFSDDASSARWYAPGGCTLRLNDDDFGDSNFPGRETRTLPGNGAVHGVPRLSALRNDANDTDVDDALTSAQFLPDCSAYYSVPMEIQWDFDRNGIFERVGAVQTWSAANADGPSTAFAFVRARHPADGRATSALVTIRVENVAPRVTSVGVRTARGSSVALDPRQAVIDAAAGSELVVEIRYDDAGRADTHRGAVDWGACAGCSAAPIEQFASASGDAVGYLRARHRYSQPGTYTASFTIADDDGGCTVQRVLVRVR